MSFCALSVHMLCGLFMLIAGKPNFFETVQSVTSTAVAVPGLDLPAVISYCRSIQTSPMPGVCGLNSGGCAIGSRKRFCMKTSRLGTSLALPLLL